MDVRMPDGTIVKNVPEGTTQEELQALLKGEPPKAKPEDLGVKSMADLWRLAGPLDSLGGAWDAAMGLSRGAQQIVARPLRSLERMVPGSVAGNPLLGGPAGAGWANALEAEQEASEAKAPDTLSYKAGKLAGDVTVGAIPFMAAAKPAQLLNAAKPAMQTVRGAFAGGTALGASAPSRNAEDQVFNAMLEGTLSGGAQKGVDIVAPWLAGPVKSKLDAAGRQAVEWAKERGFDLSPGQESGNPWLQLFESAMRYLPTTTGRESKRAMANQALLEKSVRDLDPNIPEAVGQDAALKGYTEGLADEQKLIDQGYRDVLGGETIKTDAVRQPVQAAVDRARTMPEDQQGGAALKAAQNLLGDPHYNPAKGAQAWTPRPVDAAKDDIVTAVRKLGGIDPTDPRVGSNVVTGLPFQPDPRLGPVWSKQQFAGSGNRTNTARGHSLESMAQKLYQEGYINSPDALDDILDKLSDSIGGGKQHYSTYFDHAAANVDPLASAIESLTAQMAQKNAPKPGRPGYLRENPEIPGERAQAMRSNYTTEGHLAGSADEKKLYFELRDAIDSAIESSLGKSKADQFKAVKERYKIFATLEQMTPENQSTFLRNLFAGSDSPDRFFTFLGLAPQGRFRTVAGAFLTDLVEKSTVKGSVSGRALARATDTANEDALRFLGGDAGQELWRLGRIGGRALPEGVPNSGTAQREFMLSLLTGGAITGGGALNSEDALAGAAKFGGGTLALPYIIQALYYKDKRALANAIRQMGPTMARSLGLQGIHAFGQREKEEAE